MATSDPTPAPSPMADFLQQIASTFGIDAHGTVTLELQYVNGAFRWARLHSGPIGQDDLERMNSAAA